MHTTTNELAEYIDSEDKDPQANVAQQGFLVDYVTRHRDGKTMMDMYLANLDEPEAVEAVHRTLTTIHGETRKDLLSLLRKLTVYDYTDIYAPPRSGDAISFGRTIAHKMFGVPEMPCVNANLRRMNPQPQLAAPPADNAQCQLQAPVAGNVQHGSPAPSADNPVDAAVSKAPPPTSLEPNTQSVRVVAVPAVDAGSGFAPLLFSSPHPQLVSITTTAAAVADSGLTSSPAPKLHSESVNTTTTVLSEARGQPNHEAMNMLLPEQIPKMSGLQMCDVQGKMESAISSKKEKTKMKIAEKRSASSACSLKRGIVSVTENEGASNAVTENTSDPMLQLTRKKTREGQ
ncbi:hypothetical protein CBR_g57093 [Chara braunii]|uniref:Uncharacterized protein n=1 Tax=Chara braunii TaxID=69332 RepID=A0A388K828_CHABU|nr:hypothetical protein CBR_g57093 [Chara braunii]|eukprot:GBG66214.1 hypothetical protein CBR_g57093 [Chara braunii]